MNFQNNHGVNNVGQQRPRAIHSGFNGVDQAMSASNANAETAAFCGLPRPANGARPIRVRVY
jgi:hypothetical protein